MVSMPLRAYLNPACNHIIAGCHHSFNSATKYRRALSSLSSSFIELSSKHSSKYQVYISKTHDPFINLSIEHYLLQKTHADSTILFLYINNPCVVIGRNQNPWLEANFRLLAKQAGGESIAPLGTIQQLENPKQVQLVRRRSGGGAVFHDHGNYNYSVICPSRDFSRDKHLEMVVQAIRHDNDRARINERHDIILDQGPKLSMDSWPDHLDMYRTTYSVENGNHVPLKVSGSAYKLTRERCLHHGTCLIDSQNIDHISMYLRSPVRPFMKARGVESVRTPISNVYGADVENASQRFERQVLGAFANMYRLRRGFMRPFNRPTAHRQLEHDEDWVSGYVTNALAEIPEIRSGIRELQVCTVKRTGGLLVLTWLQSRQIGFTDRLHNSCCQATLQLMTTGFVPVCHQGF